jgi:hypothetical protein
MRIFIEEIERPLCTAAGPTRDSDRPSTTRQRLGVVSFLDRSGSAINHHVQLHACATNGVFMPTGDGPPAFLPARPITQPDLAALTEKVRRREQWAYRCRTCHRRRLRLPRKARILQPWRSRFGSAPAIWRTHPWASRQGREKGRRFIHRFC